MSSRLPLQAVFKGKIDPEMQDILQFIWEELRKVINTNSYVSVVPVGLLAARPTPGSGDAGQMYFAVAPVSTLYVWSGTAWYTVDTRVQDPSDGTKILHFDQSGVVTGKATTLFFISTVNRNITFPDDSGNVVYATVTLTSNQLLLGGGTSKAALLGSLGTTVQVLHGNAAGAPTWGAVVLTADVSGTLPVGNGGTGVTYDRVFALVDLTAQVATTGPTTIASAGDHFVFSYSLFVTTADGGSAATLTVTVNYTDDIGATVQTGAALAVTATNRQTGIWVIRRASGNVTYTVTVTGAIGTAVFAFRATLERQS